MIKLINGVLAAVCFVILTSDVLAAVHEIELRDQFAAPSDTIDLSEAVSIAEARVDGRALDARLDSGRWELTLTSPEGRMHVWIDARTGAVSITKVEAVR